MKRLLTGCYAVVLVLSAALPALASQAAPPRYQSSEPSDGATVHEPPDRVEATFDQPLDESSRLLVRDECGRRVDDGATEVETRTMSVGLEKKPSGEYHVEYVAKGIGGVTGTGRGHFMFTAHGGEGCDGKGHRHEHQKNKEKHRGHDPKKQHEGHDPKKEHSGANHESGTHTGGGGDHETHETTGTTNSGHDGHRRGGHGGKHGDHGDASGSESPVASGEVPGITSPERSRKILSRADSDTLLLALGLCLALGALGGAILRTSGVR